MSKVTRSPLVGECSAEFLGTMILILFGCGVVAQVVTGGTPLTTAPGATGDYNSIAWGWGLGVAMAVFVATMPARANITEMLVTPTYMRLLAPQAKKVAAM